MDDNYDPVVMSVEAMRQLQKQFGESADQSLVRPMRVFTSDYLDGNQAIRIRSRDAFGFPSMNQSVIWPYEYYRTRPSILRDFENWFIWAKRKHEPEKRDD